MLRTLTLTATAALLCSASVSQAHAVSNQMRGHSNPQQGLVQMVAVNTDGAHKFIENVTSQGIDFLANPDLSYDQRKQEFRTLLKNNFDINTIARFSLGRYWRTATEAQRQEYLKLFEDMIIDVYSKRFGDYQGQDLEIGQVRAQGDKDAIVTTKIVPKNDPEIQVDWRVRQKGNGYKVIDIIVEGVSMAVTQRSDFSSVIQRGGGDVSVLLDHLRK